MASRLFEDDVPYDQAVAEVMSHITRAHQRADNQDTAEAAHFLIRSQEEQLVAQKNKKVA